MYQVLRRPEGRPWATPADWLALSERDPLPQERPLVVLMRENRSTHEHQTVGFPGTFRSILAILSALEKLKRLIG